MEREGGNDQRATTAGLLYLAGRSLLLYGAVGILEIAGTVRELPTCKESSKSEPMLSQYGTRSFVSTIQIGTEIHSFEVRTLVLKGIFSELYRGCAVEAQLILYRLIKPDRVERKGMSWMGIYPKRCKRKPRISLRERIIAPTPLTQMRVTRLTPTAELGLRNGDRAAVLKCVVENSTARAQGDLRNMLSSEANFRSNNKQH
ncbi:hypothetical protein DFH09DRAFT_1100166 [Mycena vulgaris]|nr:hypothetical protein DFH09DRAFT_1100166 [Mycena vulgaris]